MPTSALPRGQTIDVLVKTETAFGTPATGNYLKTYIYSDGLEETQGFVDDDLLGQPRNNDRDKMAPAPDLPKVEGPIVVPIDFNHSGLWLHSLFGDATVTGVTDFSHEFTSGKEVLPHKTYERKLASALFMQFPGLLINQASVTLSKKSGYARMNLAAMFKRENKLGASGGGTPVAPWARDPVTETLPVAKIGGTIVGRVLQLDWNYNNQAKQQDYVSGDGYPTGHDLDTPATCDGSMKVRILDATYYDLGVAQTPVGLELLWEASATRSLSLLTPATRLEKVGFPVAGPGGYEIDYKFRAEQSAAAPMLTATLKNSVVAAYA